METILIILHLLASIGVIGLVLLQNGKGADAGSAFGGGNSGGSFGIQGSSNFMTKATAFCVTLFFITSISLALVASNKHGDRSVVDASSATANYGTRKRCSRDRGCRRPSPWHPTEPLLGDMLS